MSINHGRRPGESRAETMERENQEFQAIQREAQLKGSPVGDQRCDNCRFYVAPWREMGYCNHPKLELLVGADWWCQWWEATES